MNKLSYSMNRKVHTVVMVRHGESQWNVEKRFTGWCDVPLTKHGEGDAKDAGALMVIRNFYNPYLHFIDCYMHTLQYRVKED